VKKAIIDVTTMIECCMIMIGFGQEQEHYNRALNVIGLWRHVE